MVGRFPVGVSVQRREVLHGHVWMSMPVRIVADDEVLAVWLAEGTPLTFPVHPFGRHPWSALSQWSGTSVLQLHRQTDGYAVWAVFRGTRLDYWYINFQAPYRRSGAGFDTLDHGIDIVIRDQIWQWKDFDDIAEQVATGRLTRAEADAVGAEAERVSAALDRGECWWLPRWGLWNPGKQLARPT